MTTELNLPAPGHDALTRYDLCEDGSGNLSICPCPDGAYYLAEEVDPMLRTARDSDARTEVEQLKHERDLLGSAIADLAFKAGVINGEVPITGPMLLMLCENMAAMFAAASQRPTVPTGWSIKRFGEELMVTAPNGKPGGMTFEYGGSLERKLLFRLAEAMLAAPQPQAEIFSSLIDAAKAVVDADDDGELGQKEIEDLREAVADAQIERQRIRSSLEVE